MVHLVRLTLGAKLPRHGETYQRSCSYARTSWKRWLGMKKAVKTSSIVEHHLESWASCHRRTLVERPIRVPKHCQKVKASSCITSQQAQCGEMQPQCEKGPHCRISSSGQSPNTVKTVTCRTEVVARQWDPAHTPLIVFVQYARASFHSCLVGQSN